MIDFYTSQSINVLPALGWFSCLMVAAIGLHRVRETPVARQFVLDLSLLCSIMLMSGAFTCYHALETMTQAPGERAIGVDLLTTILFHAGLVVTVIEQCLRAISAPTEALNFTHHVSRVQKRTRQRLYYSFIFFLGMLGFCASSLVYGVLFDPRNAMYYSYGFFVSSCKFFSQRS